MNGWCKGGSGGGEQLMENASHAFGYIHTRNDNGANGTQVVRIQGSGENS